MAIASATSRSSRKLLRRAAVTACAIGQDAHAATAHATPQRHSSAASARGAGRVREAVQYPIGLMSRDSHWNRNARRSGGDRRFTLPIPNVGADFAILTMQIAIVRDKLGQEGVDRYIADLRQRGDLECDDAQAQELAKP